MLHIAICDDEKVFVDHLKELLSQYILETGEEIKTSVFYDGLDLIEKYDPSFDLIFLDIQMKMVDGLRAAEKIREKDESIGIIFLTTLAQYGLEGYKYQAANYIIKPLQYGRLKAELDRFIRRRPLETEPFLVVSNDTGKYKILLKNLRYIETFNRNLLFHTEKESILCYRSMKEIERTLQGKGFARCHTSYLINLAYVKGVRKLEITLITGEKIPISQPRRKAFMEKLTDYWGDML